MPSPGTTHPRCSLLSVSLPTNIEREGPALTSHEEDNRADRSTNSPIPFVVHSITSELDLET